MARIHYKLVELSTYSKVMSLEKEIEQLILDIKSENLKNNSLLGKSIKKRRLRKLEDNKKLEAYKIGLKALRRVFSSESIQNNILALEPGSNLAFNPVILSPSLRVHGIHDLHIADEMCTCSLCKYEKERKL